MNVSPSFKIIIRLVGCVGICLGAFFVVAALAFLITKAPEVHIFSLVFGLALLVGCGYLACGAPHLFRSVPRGGSRRPAPPA